MSTTRVDLHTDTLAHLLWELHARAGGLAEAAMSGTHLSMASSGCLQTIAESPGVTSAELARMTPSSQQAVSQVVARLEKRGWVERRLGSGRGVGLHLTEEGERMRARGADAEAEIELALRERLGEETYERACAVLREAREKMTG